MLHTVQQAISYSLVNPYSRHQNRNNTQQETVSPPRDFQEYLQCTVQQWFASLPVYLIDIGWLEILSDTKKVWTVEKHLIQWSTVDVSDVLLSHPGTGFATYKENRHSYGLSHGKQEPDPEVGDDRFLSTRKQSTDNHCRQLQNSTPRLLQYCWTCSIASDADLLTAIKEESDCKRLFLVSTGRSK